MATKQIIKKVPFSRLSKANKRIELAKDVIAQVKAKKYIASLGTYFERYSIIDQANDKEVSNKDQINKILPELKCECCAKGALFLADITKRNHCTVNEFETLREESETIEERLDGIFSKDQLDLIETAFECAVIRDENSYLQLKEYDDSTITDIAKKAIKFGSRYKNESNRLIAIMSNLIKNNGEFQP